MPSPGKLPLAVSFQAAAALKGDATVSERTARRRERQALDDFLQAESPLVGPLIQTVSVPLEATKNQAAEVFAWQVINPVTFLKFLSEKQAVFGDLLKEVCDKRGQLRVALYFDEIKPGNVLRPDVGKSQICWYWTIMDLPCWFRSRQESWFHLTAFPSKFVGRVRGGNSNLFARLLGVFFQDSQDTLSFTTGFPVNTSAGIAAVTGAFSCFVGDEKSIKEVFCLKGASGTKPCAHCLNVLGHMGAADVIPGSGLVHFACVDPTLFEPHTVATFQVMVDKLAACRTKQERNKLGQKFGISYDPCGLLWDSNWKVKINPVQHVFGDWMHIIASGGVATYTLNEVAKALREQGVALHTLDEYCAQWSLPHRLKGHRLPKTFFQDRVCEEEAAAIRTLAGEAVTAVFLLNALGAELHGQHPDLADHWTCLSLMARILAILAAGDEAVQQAQELENLIRQHAALFLALFPKCVKPKLHWLFHVPTLMRHFEVNLSCWVMERKHRAVKTAAGISSGKTAHANLAVRAAYENAMSFIARDGFGVPCSLDLPRRPADWALNTVKALLPGAAAAWVSASMSTPRGVLADFILLYNLFKNEGTLNSDEIMLATAWMEGFNAQPRCAA